MLTVKLSCRLQKWHATKGDAESPRESFGRKWSASDVRRFELGMRTTGFGRHVARSVNGSFDAPNGVAFTDASAEPLELLAAGQCGRYRVNLSDRPFAHAPPAINVGGAEHASVSLLHGL